MLKLKKNVVEFIKANVKHDYGEELIWAIEHKVFCTSHFSIDRHETLNGVDLSLQISASDFEEVEELKPYKWYPRSMWDENPNKYWMIEMDSEEYCKVYNSSIYIDRLSPTAVYFMYIEPIEVEDEDL